MNLFSLNGKKALVKGGANRLGLAMVKGLHELPYGTPDDVRGTVIFLASAASDYIRLHESHKIFDLNW